MKTDWLVRLGGLGCVVGGACLVTLIVRRGICIGEAACNGQPLPGAGPDELGLGVAALGLLVAAAVSLVVAAGRRVPARPARRAAAVCGLGGVLFGVAAGIAIAKTGGETWLMPVLVFPALLLTMTAIIVVAVAVQRAQLVPRWATVTVIVAAALLPLFTREGANAFTPAVLGAACVVLGVQLVARGDRAVSPPAAR